MATNSTITPDLTRAIANLPAMTLPLAWTRSAPRRRPCAFCSAPPRRRRNLMRRAASGAGSESESGYRPRISR